MNFSILLTIIVMTNCIEDNYTELKASEKMEWLWKRIEENKTPLSFYSHTTNLGILFSSLKPTFENMLDVFPKGRKKLIHTVGKVAKAKYVSTADHPYTGIFEGCDNVILRLSIAESPNTQKTSPEGALNNFTPGMAIKFLRDSVPSANTHVMYSVSGQNSWNIFKNDFSNHIPSADAFKLHLLAFKFSFETSFVQTLGLRDLAAFNSKGDAAHSARYPFQLILKPNDELRKRFPDNFEKGYMEQMETVKAGTHIYQVYAVDQPNEPEKKIGEFITESDMISSRFGDESLFFRHNKMDIDLDENKCWRNHVPKFSIFGSKTDNVQGCPFHQKKSDL